MILNIKTSITKRIKPDKEVFISIFAANPVLYTACMTIQCVPAETLRMK